MTTRFYRAFEDRYRGSAELVASRLSVYLPLVVPLARANPQATLTDVGCGRGEWLALLKSQGVPAQGVDMDDAMLQACRERGLDAQRGDAIDYLGRLPDASQFAVTGFHFAEHIPFDALHTLARQAFRVLRPGGLLVLETPNPESLIVSTTDFRLDPSHDHPIPPKLLGFLAEYVGFEDAKILRLQERRDLSPAGLSLWDVLTGTSPDYALVARKPGAPLPEEAAQALRKEYGVTLQSLALEYDDTMRTTFLDVRARIDETREASEASAAAAVAGLSHRLDGELESLRSQQAETQAQLAALDAYLRDMLQSRSWRITAPLRWATERLRRLRDRLGGRVVPRSAPPPSPPADADAPDLRLTERGRKVLREIESGPATHD